MQLDVTAKPLLSVASLDFLLGTWTADVGAARRSRWGSYMRFKRELDGRILARHATTDAGVCADPDERRVCAPGFVLRVPGFGGSAAEGDLTSIVRAT